MINVIGDWLDVVYKVLTGIFVIWLYLDRKNDKTNQRISELETNIDKRLDGFSDRMTRVEVDLSNAPSHNDLGKIYDEIRKQSEAMSAISANVAAQASTLKSLNDWIGRVDSFLRGKN